MACNKREEKCTGSIHFIETDFYYLWMEGKGCHSELSLIKQRFTRTKAMTCDGICACGLYMCAKGSPDDPILNALCYNTKELVFIELPSAAKDPPVVSI